MTLKNCCSDLGLTVESIKNKAWFFCITVVLFFFSLSVPLTICLQRCHSSHVNKDIHFINDVKMTLEHLVNYNEIVAIIMIALAILSSMIFFSFLHSKQKVDFFHSLPVSRKRYYVTQYLAGAFSVLVPYLFFYLLNLVIIAVFGDFRYLSDGVIWLGLLRPIIYFLAIYSLSVVAAMLTGNVLVHFCAAVYLLVAVPMVLLLAFLLMEAFYETFMIAGIIWDKILYWSSPVFQYLMVVMKYQPESPWYLLITFLGALVIAAVGLILYCRRSSESAGKAIAFPWFKAIVKYPLSIAGGIALGLFLNSMAYSQVALDAWFILGSILGLILINRMIEVIFAFDIGALKLHWLSVAVSIVVAAAIVAVPALDLTGYDSYLPKESDVAKVIIGGDAIFYGDGTIYAYTAAGQSHSSIFEEQYGHFTLDQKDTIAAALKLAENGIEHRRYYKKTANESDEVLVDDGIIPANFSMAFVLKNGKIIYRNYLCVNKKETLDAIETIVNDESLRERQLEYLEQDDLIISDIDLSEVGLSTGSLSAANQKQLVEAYKEDMADLTFDRMKESPMIGFIDFSIDYEHLDQSLADTEKVFFREVFAPIYDCFERTKEVLNDMGFDVDREDYSISAIEFTPYDSENGGEAIPADRFDEIMTSTISSNEIYRNYFCCSTDDEGTDDEGGYYSVTFQSQNASSVISSERQNGYRWATEDALEQK